MFYGRRSTPHKSYFHIRSSAMLSVTHAHRSYHNLKAYRSASDLCSVLFWQSRTFPSSLYNSLTRPLRERSFRVFQAVLRIWKNRHNGSRTEFRVERALDEIWMLRQYVIRAREEEVLTIARFDEINSRLDDLTALVQRLRQGLEQMA